MKLLQRQEDRDEIGLGIRRSEGAQGGLPEGTREVAGDEERGVENHGKL